MLSESTLVKIAKSRFEEAEILYNEKKFDGAVYLCGYALELMLKFKIVKTLEWGDGYPETRNEFKKLGSLKTHDLDILLKFSGLEDKIKGDTKFFAQWQIVSTWKSDIRYKQIGSVSESDAKQTIEATRSIINNVLLK
ncbi:MAG: HEPN domain-containing protein [Candidatus Paceibacterota bacterium]